MLSPTEIEIICTASLAGGFGLRLVEPREIAAIVTGSAEVRALKARIPAVRNSVRRGTKQGNK